MTNTALWAFLIASIVLAVTPGPGVIYIVTRTLSQGRAAGASSVAGVACGNLLNSLGASLGLAALFAVSALAFEVVKYAGAAYLVWLGIRMLRAPARVDAQDSNAPSRPASSWRVFREGVLVAILNPKTTIFFAAFLPQFMNADAPALPQALMLGAIFVVVAASSDLVYVMLAAWLARRWRARTGSTSTAGVGGAPGAAPALPSWGRYASGGALIALGVASAFAGQRNAR